MIVRGGVARDGTSCDCWVPLALFFYVLFMIIINNYM